MIATVDTKRAEEILNELWYPDNLLSGVQALIREEWLKHNKEVQLLEYVTCVVFLACYLADFAEKYQTVKMTGILRKSRAKMAPRSRRAALALPLNNPLKVLLADETATAEARVLH